MLGLYIERDATWRTDLISELMSFPVGVHDDQADALGLVGQLLDRMERGKPLPNNTPKPAQPTGTVVLAGAPMPVSGSRIKL